jgi:hypothetical protein
MLCAGPGGVERFLATMRDLREDKHEEAVDRRPDLGFAIPRSVIVRAELEAAEEELQAGA